MRTIPFYLPRLPDDELCILVSLAGGPVRETSVRFSDWLGGLLQAELARRAEDNQEPEPVQLDFAAWSDAEIGEGLQMCAVLAGRKTLTDHPFARGFATILLDEFVTAAIGRLRRIWRRDDETTAEATAA